MGTQKGMLLTIQEDVGRERTQKTMLEFCWRQILGKFPSRSSLLNLSILLIKDGLKFSQTLSKSLINLSLSCSLALSLSLTHSLSLFSLSPSVSLSLSLSCESLVLA